MGRIGRRVDKLEEVSQAMVQHRSEWDLSVFDDDELEQLAVLVRKAESETELGHAGEWSAEGEALLERLDAKWQATGGATANARA